MITSKDITLVDGLAALITLIGIQLLLAELAAQWALAERIINGEPSLLLSRGKFIPRALKRERVTEEEVRAAIRGKGITRVEEKREGGGGGKKGKRVAWEAKGPGRSSLVDATVPGGTRVEESESAGRVGSRGAIACRPQEIPVIAIFRTRGAECGRRGWCTPPRSSVAEWSAGRRWWYKRGVPHRAARDGRPARASWQDAARWRQSTAPDGFALRVAARNDDWRPSP